MGDRQQRYCHLSEAQGKGTVGRGAATLSKESRVYRQSVFVSFDYDNDRNYKYFLEAWNANPRFQFVF